MVLNLISDFVQEAMPKRREDVAPFLQRVSQREQHVEQPEDLLHHRVAAQVVAPLL